MQIIKHPSPNFGPRRDTARPDLIVLHYTAMTTAQAALKRLCDPLAEVSAHYLIGRCGQVWQMVDEDQRAWHAGAGAWGGVNDVNSRSIGIELSNSGAEPFSELLMRSLEGLLQDIMARWDIPPERVIGHSDMAPHRKFDPGPRFDWCRLAREGLAVWPENTQENAAAELSGWRDYAEVFGYAIGLIDSEMCEDPEAAAFTAFRHRFRPGVKGPMDLEDLRIMQNLARRFPVDRCEPTA